MILPFSIKPIFYNWYEQTYSTILPEMGDSSDKDNDHIEHSLNMARYDVDVVDLHLPIPEARPVRIYDFGCGLGRIGVGLGLTLIAKDVGVELRFRDITPHREDFANYMAELNGLRFIEANISQYDIIIAREVFEHLEHPVVALSILDYSLKPGGILLTAVKDHLPSKLHIHPDLSDVREYLDDHGYTNIWKNAVYQKRIK